MTTGSAVRSGRRSGSTLVPWPTLLLLLLTCAGLCPGQAAERPNVILILADDLGYGDLAGYGHRKFKTPRLDRMAAEGVRFTQFHAPAAFCAPTRASLLTGRYPSRCRMTGNPAPDGGPQADRVALPADEILLPEVLRKAGYRTEMLGKWHLGHHPGFLPTDRGFDAYFGIPYSNDMRPVKLLRDRDTADYPVIQATLTQRYTDFARDAIRRSRKRPFFLYLAHAMPHKPLAASEGWYRKSGAGLYGDVIAELDAGIGAVLDAVREAGLDRKTLVLFTSDNGPWFGGSSGGLRGMKGATYEGGFRVPLIARWPGVLPAGRTTQALSTMPDLFPTILAALGIAPPGGRVLDGRDLLPVMQRDAPSPHPTIIGHQGGRPVSIRDAEWKLHVVAPVDRFGEFDPAQKWTDPRAPDGVTILAPVEQCQPAEYPGVRTGAPAKAEQLFRLRNDPAEQADVASDNGEVVRRLRREFDAFAASL